MKKTKITQVQRIAQLEKEVTEIKQVTLRLFGEVQSILKVFTKVEDEE